MLTPPTGLSANPNVPSVTLHNAAAPGLRMPVAGLGTDLAACENASASGNQSFHASQQWLALGGRRFDGALSYGCDRGVGNAIRMSGIDRKEIFVTSKVGPGGLPFALGFNEALEQARLIREQLGTHIDLLLIHEPFSYWPGPRAASKAPSTDPNCNLTSARYSERGCRLSTWRALVQLWQAGTFVRSIGVSNYNSSHIEEIAEAGLPLPAVNQLEFSPHHGPSHRPCTCGHSTSRSTLHCDVSAGERHESCAELMQYMRRRGIAFNGYSPFGGGRGAASLLGESALRAIAKAHNVSSSQVVLNWEWRRHGVLVNPTATSEEYQRLNERFDGFALSDEEMDRLDAWPQTPPAAVRGWWDEIASSSSPE
jgi:diketogulonate reductase-like aldo/keto reductase